MKITKQITSGSLNHEIDSRLLSIFSECTQRVGFSIDSHNKSAKTGKDGQFVVFFKNVKHNTIGNIVKVILFRRFVCLFGNVHIRDIVAVRDPDQEGLFESDGVDLCVNINFHV